MKIKKETKAECLQYEKDRIDLIKVNWLDAKTIFDTITLKDLKTEKLMNVISVGYLIDEDEDAIKISNFIFPDLEHDLQDMMGQSGFRNVTIIPKKLIKSILSLKIDFEESKKWRKK